MSEKSLKKNALYSAIKAFMTLLFPLITFRYASRLLLPDGIGKINFANSIVSYFTVLAGLGINSYAIREASKIKNDRLQLTKFFREIITINFCTSIISYVLFFSVVLLVPKFLDYRNLLYICSIKILFTTIGIEWMYIANEEFRYITIRSFIFQIVSLIYLFIFVKQQDDLIHYAIFGLISSVGSNICNLISVNRFIDFKYHCKLEIKKHFKFIFIFFGMTAVTSIYTMLDSSMLGFLSSDYEVGLYTASTKMSHMVLSLLTAITSVLLPRMTSYVQDGNTEKFKDLCSKSANILILISVPMIFGLCILAKPIIIFLCGEDYLPAIPAMIVISPIILIISLGSLCGAQILPSLGKEKVSLFSYIAGACINIILNFSLIPHYGALGAGIGTLAAECTVTLIQIITTRRYVLSKGLAVSFLQSVFASFIMCVFIILNLQFIDSIILGLISSLIIGICIYSSILFMFKNTYFIYYATIFYTKIKKRIN